ncbi:hypothetical protein [Streptomyces sp. WMMC940]|uniref:hypothetical protein n=1 Tax=Streptomyces sp. WMMC940 TaxID=3015153 RepID=UPI002FC2883E
MNIDDLGMIHYDLRRGVIVTSLLQGWRDVKDPRVVEITSDLTERKEAIRMKRRLLLYAPKRQHAVGMRTLAKESS